MQADHLRSYWAYKNAWSMDGLPGMKRGTVAAKKYSVAPSTFSSAYEHPYFG